MNVNAPEEPGLPRRLVTSKPSGEDGSPLGEAGFIDSHCHLQSDTYSADLEDVLSRSRAAGLRFIVVPGSNAEDNPPALDLVARVPELFAVCGIHPHHASSLDDALLARLRGWLTREKVVGVGETGLDYHYMHSPMGTQQQAFIRHMELAREFDLPLVVHSREAPKDTLELLSAHARGLSGVLHCFSGDADMARAALDLGFFISIAGPVTYKKSDALREIVKEIPIERLLIETDAPYLAPLPFRGKRNEPAWVVHTAGEVARVKGLSMEDVARITSLNTARLFRLPVPQDSARIAYAIRNSLYLNITNRCTNACTFCIRDKDPFVKGHNLRLESEPDAGQVRAAIGDPSGYDEVVFCGYGEPLLRLDLVKEIAAWLKEKRVKIRINTNGQANRIHGRNILPELAGLIDVYSISLNAADAETYDRLCAPSRPGMWEAVVEFLREAKQYAPSVTATAVEVPGLDIGACRALAESLGVEFRSRAFNDLG